MEAGRWWSVRPCAVIALLLFGLVAHAQTGVHAEDKNNDDVADNDHSVPAAQPSQPSHLEKGGVNDAAPAPSNVPSDYADISTTANAVVYKNRQNTDSDHDDEGTAPCPLNPEQSSELGGWSACLENHVELPNHKLFPFRITLKSKTDCLDMNGDQSTISLNGVNILKVRRSPLPTSDILQWKISGEGDSVVLNSAEVVIVGDQRDFTVFGDEKHDDNQPLAVPQGVISSLNKSIIQFHISKNNKCPLKFVLEVGVQKSDSMLFNFDLTSNAFIIVACVSAAVLLVVFVAVPLAAIYGNEKQRSLEMARRARAQSVLMKSSRPSQKSRKSKSSHSETSDRSNRSKSEKSGRSKRSSRISKTSSKIKYSDSD